MDTTCWDVAKARDGKWAVIARIDGRYWMEMGGRRFDAEQAARQEMARLKRSDLLSQRAGLQTV